MHTTLPSDQCFTFQLTGGAPALQMARSDATLSSVSNKPGCDDTPLHGLANLDPSPMPRLYVSDRYRKALNCDFR